MAREGDRRLCRSEKSWRCLFLRRPRARHLPHREVRRQRRQTLLQDGAQEGLVLFRLSESVLGCPWLRTVQDGFVFSPSIFLSLVFPLGWWGCHAIRNHGTNGACRSSSPA